MKATLKNYRQPPRKVRLVADTVRGVPVSKALLTLSTLPRKASAPLKKLIQSAAANAKETSGTSSDDLVVKEIRVDKGFMFRRWRARARGRAAPVRKRTSHVTVKLASRKSEAPSTKSQTNHNDQNSNNKKVKNKK